VGRRLRSPDPGRRSHTTSTIGPVGRARLRGRLKIRARQLLVLVVGHRAAPDTGRNVLMLPMSALSAPRQRKPLESHDLVTTARVHHAARRRGRGNHSACREPARDLRPSM
jgi:hypothetical protein